MTFSVQLNVFVLWHGCGVSCAPAAAAALLTLRDNQVAQHGGFWTPAPGERRGGILVSSPSLSQTGQHGLGGSLRATITQMSRNALADYVVYNYHKSIKL